MRGVPSGIIDRAIERLRRLDSEHAEGDEILDLVDANTVSDEETKPIGQIQRHLESSNRLVIRNLDTIKRWHRWDAEGWGKYRREQEKRREEARRGLSPDPRLILDENGTIREPWGYEGDVAAGLARYAAANMAQPYEGARGGVRGRVSGPGRNGCGGSCARKPYGARASDENTKRD